MIKYGYLLLMFAAVPAQSQNSSDSAAVRRYARPYAAAAVGGIVGVGIGWLAGSAIGTQTADCDYPDAAGDMCGLEQFAIGAIAGGTIGAATGAYVATRLAGARTHPLISIVGSFVGLGTGFLVGAALDRGLGVSCAVIDRRNSLQTTG